MGDTIGASTISAVIALVAGAARTGADAIRPAKAGLIAAQQSRCIRVVAEPQSWPMATQHACSSESWEVLRVPAKHVTDDAIARARAKAVVNSRAVRPAGRGMKIK